MKTYPGRWEGSSEQLTVKAGPRERVKWGDGSSHTSGKLKNTIKAENTVECGARLVRKIKKEGLLKVRRREGKKPTKKVGEMTVKTGMGKSG